MPDNAAPFPKLRAAYLQAIARAWRDPAYEQELFNVSKENPLGALPMLERDYHFTLPWRVKFAISGGKKRPFYTPIGTTGWFGFGDEFTIPLPKEPPEGDDLAAALALYIHRFPSLLGTATDGVTEAPPDFAAFGAITARVLALTWRDKAFKKTLFELDDARQFVQGAMNYLVPWNFRLKFYQCDVLARSTPLAFAEAFEKFPYSTITVWLPRRPEVRLDDEDIARAFGLDEAEIAGALEMARALGALSEPSVDACALAAYNDTGSAYPFTCI